MLILGDEKWSISLTNIPFMQIFLTCSNYTWMLRYKQCEAKVLIVVDSFVQELDSNAKCLLVISNNNQFLLNDYFHNYHAYTKQPLYIQLDKSKHRLVLIFHILKPKQQPYILSNETPVHHSKLQINFSCKTSKHPIQLYNYN